MATEKTNVHKCWLVRHGQRLDEIPAWRETPWFDNYFNRNKRYPLDPPLTEKGSEQASSSADHFFKTYPDHKLTHIYVSPLHRTIKTSLEFAKKLNLPLIVTVGLAQCTAACRAGPIEVNNEGEWTLPSRGNIFLTKQEIRELCGDIEVSFHESNLSFNETLDLLVKENERCMVVTHREGIRPLASYNERLGYCHIQEVDFNVVGSKKIAHAGNKTVFQGFDRDRTRRKH